MLSMEPSERNVRDKFALVIMTTMATIWLVECHPLTDFDQIRVFDERIVGLRGSEFGENGYPRHHIDEFKSQPEGNTLIDGQRFHLYDYDMPTIDYDIYAQTAASSYRNSQSSQQQQQQQQQQSGSNQQQPLQPNLQQPVPMPQPESNQPKIGLGFQPPAANNGAEVPMSYLLSILPLMNDYLTPAPLTYPGYHHPHQPYYAPNPHQSPNPVSSRPMQTTVGMKVSTTSKPVQSMESTTSSTTTTTTTRATWAPVTVTRRPISVPKKKNKKVRPSVILIKKIIPLSTTTYV